MSAPTVPTVAQLSEQDARALTDVIRTDAKILWSKLLRAYEGNAHGSLGYTSWADYCSKEFDFDKTRSYRLLQAARVIEVAELPMGDSTIPNERVAREFAPLLDDPRTLRETCSKAVATAPVGSSGGVKLTAGHVRKVVQQQKQNSSLTKPDPAGLGASIRPGSADSEPELVSLNAAVATVKRAISRDCRNIDDAIDALKRSASAGLYRPGNDALAAVTELVEVVALLVEMVKESQS
mgnify:CR=1 FL=1|tara:strand:+ start:175 stop:885 length:711 start_codon:yes stop_codon:yes gene_type:complete